MQDLPGTATLTFGASEVNLHPSHCASNEVDWGEYKQWI